MKPSAPKQLEIPVKGPGVSDDRQVILGMRRPVIPVSMAAIILEYSREWTYHLVETGELESLLLFGSPYVYVSSVRLRLSLKRRRLSKAERLPPKPTTVGG